MSQELAAINVTLELPNVAAIIPPSGMEEARARKAQGGHLVAHGAEGCAWIADPAPPGSNGGGKHLANFA